MPTTTPAEASASSSVSFEALAPGVWLHLSAFVIEPWGEVSSYGLVVERGEDALLIDTAFTDAQTEEILRWADETLGEPITAAVFTHAHQDKMGGVAALRARGVATYAAADSNTLAVARGLVAAEHALAFDADGISRELAPAVVFDPGSGHSEDNVVVALPDAGVLFGGCLVRPGDASDLGNTGDADIDHWAEAVEAVAARFPEIDVVVPSHGRPAGRELLAHTATLAREAHR
jgi:glyoxylase-like metal-dependent hydrolase (beta-lactamase superfamily II)